MCVCVCECVCVCVCVWGGGGVINQSMLSGCHFPAAPEWLVTWQLWLRWLAERNDLRTIEGPQAETATQVTCFQGAIWTTAIDINVNARGIIALYLCFTPKKKVLTVWQACSSLVEGNYKSLCKCLYDWKGLDLLLPAAIYPRSYSMSFILVLMWEIWISEVVPLRPVLASFQ